MVRGFIASAVAAAAIFMGFIMTASGQEAFTGTAEPLPASVVERMTASGSWTDACPVALEDLAYLRLGFVDFAGAAQTGEMVVAANVADQVIEIFRQLFEAGFPIERMQLVDDYGADDDLSMAANNTSAFNCRAITGGTAFSQHSYGDAIDINPFINPYVRGDLVLPREAATYADRANVRPGMIVPGDVVTSAFAAIGWVWGGDWETLKDYQHFSSNGR